MVEVHPVLLIFIVVNDSVLILLLANFYAIALHWDVVQLVCTVLSLLHVQREVLVESTLVVTNLLKLALLLIVNFWAIGSLVGLLGVENLGDVALELFCLRLDVLDGE